MKNLVLVFLSVFIIVTHGGPTHALGVTHVTPSQKPFSIIIDLLPKSLSDFLVERTDFEAWFGEKHDLGYILETRRVKLLNEYGIPEERVCVVDSYFNKKQILECAEKLSHFFQRPPSHVFTSQETAIESAASIREIYKLQGMYPEQAKRFRDKVVMKSFLTDVLFPPLIELKDANLNDAITFASEHNYPLLFKPRSASGSHGIVVVANENELKSSFEEIKNTEGDLADYTLEKFIYGPTFHADGVIHNGDFVTLSVWENFPSTNYQSYRDFQPGGGVQVDDQNLFFKAQVLVKNALKSLGQQNGIFHLEFIKGDHSGELYFLETAARCGGGFTIDAVYQATGMNLFQEGARVEFGLEPSLLQEHKHEPSLTVVSYLVVLHSGPKNHTLTNLEYLNLEDNMTHKSVDEYEVSSLTWYQKSGFLGKILTNDSQVFNRWNQTAFFIRSKNSQFAKEHLLNLQETVSCNWSMIPQ